MTNKQLKALLDHEFKIRNSEDELTLDKPDPLYIAKRYNDEYISLICALFAYGNAGQIIKFLDSLDFSILDQDENQIRSSLQNHYYRFQNSQDIINFFITIKKLRSQTTLEDIFLKGYEKDHNILDGIESIIDSLYKISDHNSYGYKFLIGTYPKKDKNGTIKITANSPYKRYNMFLRWMVRSDHLDMGLWKGVDPRDLIIPLDTHTFHVSQELKLLNRKTYDLKSAILITEKLKQFDPNDPVKYDFALYRLGQEGII